MNLDDHLRHYEEYLYGLSPHNFVEEKRCYGREAFKIMLRQWISEEVIGEDEYVNMIAVSGDDFPATQAYATHERNELRKEQRQKLT